MVFILLGLVLLPPLRYFQIVVRNYEVYRIREKATTKPAFIPFQLGRLPDAHRSQVARILVGREIHQHLMPSLCGKFYCGNHVAIGGNHDSHIAVFLICICNDLRCNPHICLFFLMGMNHIPTFEAGDIFLQIFAQDQTELRVFLIRLKESILPPALLYVIRPCGEIFHLNQLLIATHEALKQLHYVKPIIPPPPCGCLQSVVKVESVNVDNNSLLAFCFHNCHIK